MAIVTGASRGLGLLLARELARQGCPLVICARDSAEPGRAAAELREAGADVTAVACDVTDEATPSRLVQAALGRHGQLNIVISNAGIIQVGPVRAASPEHFETALDTMALAPARLAPAALPVMRSQGHGRIVTIASIGGKPSVPHLLPYSTAKFAAVGFSEGLRAELGRGPVTVTTVVPGLMRAGSHLQARFTGQVGKEFTWFALGASLPLISMDAERDHRRGTAAPGGSHPDPGRPAHLPHSRARARTDQRRTAPGAATGAARAGRAAHRSRPGHRRGIPITAGDFPEWELGLQLFDDDFADRFAFDVLDPTKIIPEEEVPVRRVGRLVLDRVVGNFFAETEQVAFCTQNVVPGIDFTNDPLLQGRNFSYLDTQLKRLGGPNFTQLPVNAPKCPVAHFQQDGHMAMVNPQGRVNYEPSSWDPPGPREDPAAGFRTYPDGRGDQAGPKRRLRPESFADHYSQARQFFVSQTEVERRHIIDAFVFELSKCDREAIRTRMVAGLRNVGDDLAGPVAEGLGLPGLPDPLPAARKTVRDLPASRALSILVNGPDSFAGRKIGILVTDGVDAAKLEEVKSAAGQAQVNVELIALAVGGVNDSDGNHAPADQKIDGGPSVLYDAVVLLASSRGAPALAAQPAVRDFVADAYSHCKFIGYTGDASPLFEAAGLGGLTDDGFVSLDEHSGADFISRCAKLRFWPRQASIAQRAGAAKASAGQG